MPGKVRRDLSLVREVAYLRGFYPSWDGGTLLSSFNSTSITHPLATRLPRSKQSAAPPPHSPAPTIECSLLNSFPNRSARRASECQVSPRLSVPPAVALYRPSEVLFPLLRQGSFLIELQM